MTRRDALATALGLAVSFVVPAPRKRIDLRQFCARRDFTRFDARLPYTFADWTYATDVRVCVRVRPETADRFSHEGKSPPFDSLSWDHDRLVGWQSLRRRDQLLASNSDCPACDGFGYEGGVCGIECPACDGFDCEKCNNGSVAPPGVAYCSMCRGDRRGVFPSVVELDGRYFDASRYQKVQVLGGECRHDHLQQSKGLFPMLRFRFDGGHGLLMALDKTAVEARLV